MQRFFISAISILIILQTASSVAHAQAKGANRENVSGDESPTIFDVRKSLPMEPTDPSFHDFYINAGIEAGFKKGQYLPVQRALPIHDPVQNKQQGILTIPVGKVLVIHVERNMTVARLASELGDDERPTLEYEAIMIGDRIDMKGITTDAPKETGKKKKRSNAAAETKSEVAFAAQAAGVPPQAVTVSVVVPATAPQAAPEVNSQPASVQPAVNSSSGTDASSGTVKSDMKVPSQPSVSPQRVTQPVPPPTA